MPGKQVLLRVEGYNLGSKWHNLGSDLSLIMFILEINLHTHNIQHKHTPHWAYTCLQLQEKKEHNLGLNSKWYPPVEGERSLSVPHPARAGDAQDAGQQEEAHEHQGRHLPGVRSGVGVRGWRGHGGRRRSSSRGCRGWSSGSGVRPGGCCLLKYFSIAKELNKRFKVGKM